MTTETILPLRIHARFSYGIPLQGLTLITRLTEQLADGRWQEAGTQQTEWTNETEGDVALFYVRSGVYGIDFMTGGLEPLEGFQFTIHIDIPTIIGTFYDVRCTAYPYYTERTTFAVTEEPPYLHPSGAVPSTIPVPPSIPEYIVGDEDDPWWKPLGDIWNAFSGATVNTFIGFGNVLLSAINPIVEFFRDPYGTLISNMRNIITNSANDYAESTTENIVNLLSGTPDYQNTLYASQDALSKALVTPYVDEVDPSKWIPSEVTDENVIASALEMASRFIQMNVGQGLIGLGIEMGSLGQVEGGWYIGDRIQNSFGVTELAKAVTSYPIEKGVMLPFQHAVNSAYVNEIPPYTDLINMVVKEKISLDDFKHYMRYQGYNETWSQNIWDAHFIAPSFGDVRRAYYRSDWSQDTLLKMMKRVDLDPYYNESVWLTLLEEIPPISELVNERVKEVIGDETFRRGLKFHGFSPIWGQRIWDAHFMPPTLGDILTAYRRGVPVSIPSIDPASGSPTTRDVSSLSVADVHELMVLVDLDPRYNDIFDTRMYRDPSIREARYMYETGAIGEDNVRDIVVRSGLDPSYVDTMTHYLTHFVERTFQRRYLTALTTAYMNNTYDETQINDYVIKAGFGSGVASWIIEIGKVRRDIELTPSGEVKPKILTMAQLDKAYIRDVITEDDYTTRMLSLGYETLDIALKLRILDLDKVVQETGSRIITLTVSQMLNAWRYEEMTEDEVRIELSLRGLDTLNIDRIINTKKKQWGMIEGEEA